ncbi:type III-B CRISPR module RAMP protein Cmr1 [Hyalangium sp.]|uniref:type III-B CRISPR module RAMP protein Cmr1 n=1 Tax=Hyalangium sp. TaxID=2028555 RepID=UPI002D52DD24|nr:type III-B CRISPR module RAMP protein Cmr1 [Hyalangium sp.]HYI01567.1 type III-B CRISPR module RAMP protein Cmr1 [Hyalangium sp.]
MELPDPLPRQRRYPGGAPVESLVVQLKSTTPILGGAPVPRQVDAVDIIRVPTIRGHLRFWWRALYAHEFPTAKELAHRERALWGGVGGDAGTRSKVEVSVEVDRSSVRKAERHVEEEDDDAYYALWPARGTRTEPDAGRLLSELRFQLHLHAPSERMHEVENAVRAWVLWGGYGGRTRRGVGSLTVVEEVPKWLPRGARRDELQQVFGGLALLGSPPTCGARQVPAIQGARLFHGAPQRGPERAWFQALHWLKEFRQGQPSDQWKGPANKYARERGDRNRPGRSNWPEPDKIRRLLEPARGKPWAHPPREEYSREAAWPRAGFGLPIPIRFQEKDRSRALYRNPDPGEVELRWHDGAKVRERLASPLIVKAMPLANGFFVPVALWLHRAWPEGKVVLIRKGGQRTPVKDSFAPFDRLLASSDKALYAPLEAPSLSEAFFRWLKSHPEVKES